jgi:hypothetical protein
MKNKIVNFKKYKKSIMLAVFILVIGIISVIIVKKCVLDKNNIKELKNSNYEIQYTAEWKKSDVKDTGFVLKNNKAQIKLDIIQIEEKDKYKDIEELHDDIIYNINNENREYAFLAEEKKNFTNNNYEGYQLLYETDKTNVLLILFKDYQKIYLLTYEAPIKEFDFLLENAKNIIYSLTITQSSYESDLNSKLELSDLKLEKDDEIDKMIENTVEHTIASKNYRVTFKIPSNFGRDELNSQYYYNKFEGLSSGEELRITAHVWNTNIFNRLDRDNSSNIYAGKAYQEKNGFKESLSKISEKEYIYKYSYGNENENVSIVYEIDKSHIFEIELKAYKVKITQKIIDSIGIVNYENYAQNIDKTNILRKADLLGENIVEVKFEIPHKYIQIDKENNIYETKYYAINKNKDELYDYEAEISIITIKPESSIETINRSISKSYGKYNEMVSSGRARFNDKDFEVYDGGSTLLSGVMFTNKNRKYYYQYKKVLFYKLQEGKYVRIVLNGNDKEITNDIINDFTNFYIR